MLAKNTKGVITMAKEYIERRALLNEIEEIRPLNWTDTEAEITEQLDYDIFENLVKSHPTADVQEVRHGKWELIDECANEGVYCSNCHKKVYRAKYANQKVRSNYCPNCGAKMDKE